MDTIKISPLTLQVGQYFKSNKRWYKVQGEPRSARIADHQVPALDTDGLQITILVYEEFVEVAPAGSVPSSFTPANIRRRRRNAFHKAAELNALADRLGVLAMDQAREIEQAKSDQR